MDIQWTGFNQSYAQQSVQVWQLSPVSDLVLDRVSQQDMVQQQ